MRRRFLALLLACAPAWALAQSGNPTLAGTSGDTQDALYQEALQALAEGRKSDASRILTRLIGLAPQHAGALMDLALIQCGLGNAQGAERLFALIETRFAPTREILLLINEARDTGCRPLPAASALTVTLARGVDDNVNQGASNSTFIVTGPDGDIELPLLDDFRPKRDGYTTLGADYIRGVGANGSLGFVQVQQRKYDSLDEYDSGALFAGIESPWRFGNWALRTTASAGLTTMGGHHYQTQAQGQLRVAPPLPLPSHTQLHFTASATHTAYRSLRNFNSDIVEGRALLSHRTGTLSANATAGLLSDRARGDRPGGNRHGNYLTLSLRKPLGWNTTGELAWTRQRWNSSSPYSPELLIEQIRRQRTQVLRATLSWQLAEKHALVLEGRMVRNRENISIFQYNNRQLQLTWQWQYP